jgi:hypothetical protein
MGVGKSTYKHFVTVHGKEHEVTTYQEFKTVWIASGVYAGEYLSTMGESESVVLQRWEEMARDKGSPGVREPLIVTP